MSFLTGRILTWRNILREVRKTYVASTCSGELICELYQFISRHLTLDNLSRSNQGHMTFKSMYLLNGALYQILHENTSQIALLWWANGGPTVRVLMGQRWQPPVAHCGRVQRASVGPPLGQRWLATGGPLLAHRWLATVGPTVGQRYTNNKCAVGPTVAATGGPLWACPTSLCWPTGG